MSAKKAVWIVSGLAVGVLAAVIGALRLRHAAGPEADAGAPVTPEVDRMTVLCDRETRAISPHIYGVAYAREPEDMRASAHRWGGNTTTRYNHRIHAWNTGQDYFFENVAADRYTDLLDVARARQTFVALTVPTIGWVAKDATSYSFSVARHGPQKGVDPQHPDRGNGVGVDDQPIAPGPPTDTSLAVGPDWVARWIADIRGQSGGARRVHEYILDNEPGLWNSTHRDVHPEPVGYDELLSRTVEYATAIRRADPDALIAGPAAWGWMEYFYSAKDVAAGALYRPDRRAHQDVPLLEWYLTELKRHEERTGTRLLDVLDVHFYPQGEGIQNPDPTIGMGGATDADAVERRYRAVRGLWDKRYVDESWIKEAVFLIPRMQELIAKAYPGRKLSIGEWSFGAEQHVSSALATAEALGRFATHGVDSAFYFTHPAIKKDSHVYWAFRAFRNFDGKGGRFFDRLVPSEAPPGTSLFVSRDDVTHKLVAVAINFRGEAYAADVDVGRCGALRATRAVSYTGDPAGFRPAEVAPSGVKVTLPPSSVTVVEID